MEALDVRRRDYKRHRDARVALIRCGECGEYYETSVRQSRRIRSGESRRLCEMCRNLETAQTCTPDRTAEYVAWWLYESGLSRQELWLIVAMIHRPEEVRASEPVPSPSRRLPDEEGNHTTADVPLVVLGVPDVGGVVNCSNTT
jgi:hypothetical protein